MIVVPLLSGSRSRMNVMLLSLQTRRRRPWRWAWPTCCATIAPPPWRGRHPRLRPPRRSGSTPVRRLPRIHVRLVTTRQLNCESAVLALLARQRLIHHLLRCHAALVAALQLSSTVGFTGSSVCLLTSFALIRTDWARIDYISVRFKAIRELFRYGLKPTIKLIMYINCNLS